MMLTISSGRVPALTRSVANDVCGPTYELLRSQ
jgi:hypothetical protein